ncbi:hypothetical protein HEB94_004949 [Actinopolymorpha pittospori]|uniref:Uncharacterized protein n=1 Tax=Actinopolymorpha pittospori TaxID=648752 RepID=A0A927RKB9_9ACTN|nr:hypothetical protein [Actinopolymorpha pittospori]
MIGVIRSQYVDVAVGHAFEAPGMLAHRSAAEMKVPLSWSM